MMAAPVPFATKIHVRSNVGNWGMTGLVMLIASFVDRDPVRTMVGDGFRSNPRARSYRRRDGGDQNGDGRRVPRHCSGRQHRLHIAVTLAETLFALGDVALAWTIREGARMAAVRAHHSVR
jgi:hypothetical protein